MYRMGGSNFKPRTLGLHSLQSYIYINKKTVMTKTQFRKFINKSVFEHVSKNYPDFEIDDNEGGGRVYFIDTTSDRPGDDSIMYERSTHTMCTLNWSNERIKGIERELETWINNLIQQHQ